VCDGTETSSSNREISLKKRKAKGWGALRVFGGMNDHQEGGTETKLKSGTFIRWLWDNWERGTVYLARLELVSSEL